MCSMLDVSMEMEEECNMTVSRTFSNSKHHDECLNYMNDMRKQSVMLDVILVAADNIEVPAHRIVLEGCSQYFRDIIFDDEERQQYRVDLKSINGSVLKTMVDYMYTGKLLITAENVQDVLHASESLRLQSLRDKCYESILANLDPTNCIGIGLFAKLHGYSELRTKAEECAVRNFSIASKSREFLALPFADLIKSISNDRIDIGREEQVFELVISWVSHDVSGRKEFLSEFLEHIKLPLLSKEYLERIQMHPLIKDDSKCQFYLLEAFKYHSLRDEEKALFESPRIKSRVLKKMMLLIGGITKDCGTVVKTVECFDFLEQKWKPLNALPIPEKTCGIASNDSRVYVIGGSLSGKDTNHMTYNSLDNSWCTIRPSFMMHHIDRIEGVAAILKNSIYLVGGYMKMTEKIRASAQMPADVEMYKNDYFDTVLVEKYTLDSYSVRPVKGMSARRARLGVAILNKLLYAVGGYGTRSILSSVERYSPNTNRWETVSDMTCKRMDVGVSALNGLLYAVGGDDGNNHALKSAEVYDPIRNEWNRIADMHFGRRCAAVVGAYEFLCVVGGADDCNPESMEVFNPRSGTWTLLDAPIITDRKNHTVVLINNPKYFNHGVPIECLLDRTFPRQKP